MLTHNAQNTQIQNAEARVEWPVAMPAVNIYESGKEIVIEAEMPGFPKESVGAEIDGDALVVFGRPGRPETPEGYEPVHLERGAFEYRRTFALGADVRKDRIRAKYENGVLTLTLPKAEAAQPRKISVE